MSFFGCLGIDFVSAAEAARPSSRRRQEQKKKAVAARFCFSNPSPLILIPSLHSPLLLGQMVKLIKTVLALGLLHHFSER